MIRKSNPKIRCAIYTRKSTEEGLDMEFNTLDAQREAGEAYIASQKAEGWVCLEQHYDDGGFSGGNTERPALQRLLADIEAGKIDCVIVYKVDRLSRSLLDFARIYAGKIQHKDDVYAGEHEPIIDDRVFRKVQSRLKQNGHGGADVRNKYGALLRSLLYCKACDRMMVHTFATRHSKRYRYYVCTRAMKEGRKACPGRSLPAGEIEGAVVDEIRCIGQDRRLRREVLRQAQRHINTRLKDLQKERSGLQRELTRHDTEIRRLATNSEPENIKAAELADLHDRVVRGEKRMREIKRRVAELDGQRIDAADVDGALADFDTVWQTLTPREQARMLHLLIGRIEFDAADSSLAISFHGTGVKTLADEVTA